MREIKFRAWDKNEKAWLTFNERDDVCYDYAQMATEPGWCLTLRPYTDGVVLTQSIGLKDKNGVEVYEGDVVRWRYMAEGVGVVKYSANFASYEPFNHLRQELVRDTYEVIGNIYENPELLKDERFH